MKPKSRPLGILLLLASLTALPALAATGTGRF
jgi:hypothetical protein